MQGNDRLKKWAMTGTAACLLYLGAAPLHLLSAEELTATDQNKPATGQTEKKDRTGGGSITQGEMLTPGRCIDIAVRQNPAIVAAVNTVEASRSRVGEARSNYYPQLSASGAYNRVSPVPVTTAAVTGTRQTYDQYTASE